MSKSEKAPGGVTPEQSGKKLPGFVKKVGALALALLAAGGIWHKAHEPAMSDEQMDKATEIAAEAVLDKIDEFDGDNYYFDGHSSLFYDHNRVDSMSVFVDSVQLDDENKDTGTEVKITIDDKKPESEDDIDAVMSSTTFTFCSNTIQDLRNMEADNKVTADEIKDYLKNPDVNLVEIRSLEDEDGDGKLHYEGTTPNSYDDVWALHISKKDGTDGYSENNGYSGKKAVELTQEVVNHVKSNWNSGKTKK